MFSPSTPGGSTPQENKSVSFTNSNDNSSNEVFLDDKQLSVKLRRNKNRKCGKPKPGANNLSALSSTEPMIHGSEVTHRNQKLAANISAAANDYFYESNKDAKVESPTPVSTSGFKTLVGTVATFCRAALGTVFNLISFSDGTNSASNQLARQESTKFLIRLILIVAIFLLAMQLIILAQMSRLDLRLSTIKRFKALSDVMMAEASQSGSYQSSQA